MKLFAPRLSFFFFLRERRSLEWLARSKKKTKRERFLINREIFLATSAKPYTLNTEKLANIKKPLLRRKETRRRVCLHKNGKESNSSSGGGFKRVAAAGRRRPSAKKERQQWESFLEAAAATTAVVVSVNIATRTRKICFPERNTC